MPLEPNRLITSDSQEHERQMGAFPSVPARARYDTPQLTLLGDLRSLTLAFSPGLGESGAGDFTHRPTP